MSDKLPLTEDDRRRCDELAAYFMEGSNELIGLAHALYDAVGRYKAIDQRRREREG